MDSLVDPNNVVGFLGSAVLCGLVSGWLIRLVVAALRGAGR